MFTMEAAEAEAYVREAFRGMLQAVGRVHEDDINIQPFGPRTNSLAALIVHSTGVCEFWLGHVALGRPSNRDRDAEFVAALTTSELEARVEATLTQVAADLRQLATDGGQASMERRDLLAGGSDPSIVLHVLEELFQHLGHMELTVDVLRDRRGSTR